MKKQLLTLLIIAIATSSAIAALSFNKGWNLVSKAEIGNLSNLKNEAGVDDIWMIDEQENTWCTLKNNNTQDGIELCDINNIANYKNQVWVLANKEVRGGPFTFTIEDQDRLGNSISVQGTSIATLFVPFNTSSISIQAKVDTNSADFSFNANECNSDNAQNFIGQNLSETMNLSYISGETTCTVSAQNGDVVRSIRFVHCAENEAVGDSGKRCDAAGSDQTDSGNDNTGNAP
jgi:hypothetical protein